MRVRITSNGFVKSVAPNPANKPMSCQLKLESTEIATRGEIDINGSETMRLGLDHFVQSTFAGFIYIDI